MQLIYLVFQCHRQHYNENANIDAKHAPQRNIIQQQQNYIKFNNARTLVFVILNIMRKYDKVVETMQTLN